MKQTKHQPGIKTQRQFNNYNAFQEALWEAFDDFYYADVGDYGNMRMPTPGIRIEPTKSWNLDFNNEVIYRELVGGTKEVLITDRRPSGTAVIESVALTLVLAGITS